MKRQETKNAQTPEQIQRQAPEEETLQASTEEGGPEVLGAQGAQPAQTVQAAQTEQTAQVTQAAPFDAVSEPLIENGQVDTADTLTFSDEVIEKIVGDAAKNAEGVAGLKGGFINRVQETFGARTNKGVEVVVEEDGSVALYISIVMRFGFYAPDVFADVKQKVLAAVDAMTGLPVSSVNLRVEDVAISDEGTAAS